MPISFAASSTEIVCLFTKWVRVSILPSNLPSNLPSLLPSSLNNSIAAASLYSVSSIPFTSALYVIRYGLMTHTLAMSEMSFADHFFNFIFH